jgi:hypothetical protein
MMDFILTQVKGFVSVARDHWDKATKFDKRVLAGSMLAIFLSLFIKPLLLAGGFFAAGCYGLYIVWEDTE